MGECAPGYVIDCFYGNINFTAIRSSYPYLSVIDSDHYVLSFVGLVVLSVSCNGICPFHQRHFVSDSERLFKELAFYKTSVRSRGIYMYMYIYKII